MSKRKGQLGSAQQAFFDAFAEELAHDGIDGFVTDGCFDETEYGTQPLKVTFVLKEPHGEGWSGDLCQGVLEPNNKWGDTWNNVARWTKALLGEESYSHDASDKHDWYRKTVALNLKKTGGRSDADQEGIYQFVQKYGGWLYRQLGLYEPDVIIGCGRTPNIAQILRELVFPDQTVKNLEPIRTVNGEKVEDLELFLGDLGNGKPIPVVSFYHPNLRGHGTCYGRYHQLLQVRETLRDRGLISQ